MTTKLEDKTARVPQARAPFPFLRVATEQHAASSRGQTSQRKAARFQRARRVFPIRPQRAAEYANPQSARLGTRARGRIGGRPGRRAQRADTSWGRIIGRSTKKTEVRNGGAARVLQYGYNDAGRLETVTEDGGLAESCGYDANGNRTSSMNSSGVFSATYDDQDRIETYGSMVYGFTDKGELESKLDTSTGDLTTYEYDALGNLRGVVLSDGTEIEYLVDGQGRRVGKLVDGVLESAWLWRGQLQPVAELDGAGNVVARYVYADGVNVPEAIVMASGPTYRLVKDHLGSVRMVVDESSGAVVQELAYDAWGRVVVDTNPGLQPFGFAGGLYDAETGLVRFGARDYDAETGRWTAKDPIRFGGGLNLFGYVDGEPMNRVDPRGRDGFAIPWPVELPELWPVLAPLAIPGICLAAAVTLEGDTVPDDSEWEEKCGHLQTVADRYPCCRLACGWYEDDYPRPPDPYRGSQDDYDKYENDVFAWECFERCTDI